MLDMNLCLDSEKGEFQVTEGLLKMRFPIHDLGALSKIDQYKFLFSWEPIEGLMTIYDKKLISDRFSTGKWYEIEKLREHQMRRFGTSQNLMSYAKKNGSFREYLEVEDILKSSYLRVTITAEIFI